MPRPSLMRLADRALDGKLGGYLIGWRDEGLSWDQIAKRLHAEHDVSVTPKTVQSWHSQLVAELAAKPAEAVA